MTKSKSYQQLSTELDEVINRLQSDATDIEESILLYEQGILLTKELEKYLKTAKNKITKLKN